jgi:hypothetical protein
MQPNDPDRDPVYLEWLAAAPKGVRWDKAQEMYALYQERRKEQADAIARRLLGIRPTWGDVAKKVENDPIFTEKGWGNGTGEMD